MSSPSHQHNQPHFFSRALYCEEDHWDYAPSSCNSFNLIHAQEFGPTKTHPKPNPPLLEILEQDLSLPGHEELSFLLNKEQEENEFCNGVEGNPAFLIEGRSEAVEWMLKIVGYYSFSALTAILAVHYFDRFLRSFQLEKPWITQLSAVGCLSLAAKVEETQVPLLLDLQVEEIQYMFDSKTIQRMELLILSTLEWKMNPVTPLSFLDCISRELGLDTHFCGEFLRRSHCLLLSVVSDCRIMRYLPSALATATMLHVMSSLQPCIALQYQHKLAGILGINKEKVEECCKVMQDATRKRKLGAMLVPGSPKGALDVCFSFNSSDNSDESWPTAASVSSSPQPRSKKFKPQTSN